MRLKQRRLSLPRSENSLHGAAMVDWIRIRGARQNNLKNLDADLPKNRLVVITGPSGAGKSSLAFETLYAEGQRRYVEALSVGARQFLTQLEKPDVDAIQGLGPAIAIEQRGTGLHPRATVSTTTEIHDFLRVLFARLSQPVCHRCGGEMAGYTVQEMVDAALLREGERLLVLAPQRWNSQGDAGVLLAGFRKAGFVRIRVNGQVFSLEDADRLAVLKAEPPRTLELVIDRLSATPANKQRLTEAVELALHHGQGLLCLVFSPQTGVPGGKGGQEDPRQFSRTPRCSSCDIRYPEPHPRHFSFNSPWGACPHCQGLGHILSADAQLAVPDNGKSLAEGAIPPWEKRQAASFQRMLEQVAAHYRFSIFTPFKHLEAAQQQVLLFGSGEEVLEFSHEDGQRYSRCFEGVLPLLERRFRETESGSLREALRTYLHQGPCPVCKGGRLRVESLHHLLGGCSIAAVSAMTLNEARTWLDGLVFGPAQTHIGAGLLSEIGTRLELLQQVGLTYLSLGRNMDTLSSGESQRIRLATAIGATLSGVIYILDEPTIGLHQRDTARLLKTLAAIRDRGNTVVVVEHDRDVLAAADYLLEIGPEAGEKGGNLIACGTPAEMKAIPHSRTGRYLAGESGIPLPSSPRPWGPKRLELLGARGHNLAEVDLVLPLGMLVCITGVSGSGKSSLLLDTLHPALLARLQGRSTQPLPFRELNGAEHLERVVHIDPSPIGRSSRSNPGTYLGVFTLIREQFAAVPEARSRGYTARRFSFNVEEGRCGICQGEGLKRIEMHFLPDVFVRCDTCEGSRYNRETLEVRYRGKSIGDMLSQTISETEHFFRAIPAIRSRLQPMLEAGLGYLKLGQAAATLSGGEAQRLKIARELGRKERGRTLYLMDEPTTGLHVEEVGRLVEVLNRLVTQGNSVVVIEHNLELVKCADHVIDMGPEAGDQGGRVVAQGTPVKIAARHKDSYTGNYLRAYLWAAQP